MTVLPWLFSRCGSTSWVTRLVLFTVAEIRQLPLGSTQVLLGVPCILIAALRGPLRVRALVLVR